MRPGTIARASDYPSLGRSISAMLCSRSDLISCREIALNPVPPSSPIHVCLSAFRELGTEGGREGQCLMVHFLVIRVSCLSSEIGERSGVEGKQGDGEGDGRRCCLLSVRVVARRLPPLILRPTNEAPTHWTRRRRGRRRKFGHALNDSEDSSVIRPRASPSSASLGSRYSPFSRVKLSPVYDV